MRNPTRFALRWGAPVALAAAAIAALFVVPVFGGNGAVTQRSLKNQVQAVEKRVGEVGLGTRAKTMGALHLAKGDYVFTTTYEVSRKDPKVEATCILSIKGINDFGPTTRALGPDAAASEAIPTIESGALSGATHIGHRSTAKLKCRTDRGTATLFNIDIIALKVPKLTIHTSPAAGKK